MMLPSVEQLKDAASAINAQQPTLSGAHAVVDHVGTNEQDGNGRRVLSLTPEQVLTIASALGVASAVKIAESRPAAPSARPAALGVAVLQTIERIELERRPDGQVSTRSPRDAVPQVRELFALELARREAGAALLSRPLGVPPGWLWRELHPAPSRDELDARRLDLARAVREAREADEPPAPDWIGELVTLEVERRRDVARGPEAADYWSTAEAAAVGDELDELLAALDLWRVVGPREGGL